MLDRRVWTRFRKNRGAMVGAFLVLFVCFMGFVGPLFAPHDPNQIFDEGLQANGLPVGATDHFLLGADNLGRDILSRLFFGGLSSLMVALCATLLSLIIGFGLGLVAGYFQGLIDAVVMRFTDLILSLPFLLIAIALSRVFDAPSLTVLCILLGLLSWTTLARVTRAKTMQARELQYVHAAQAIGASHLRIVFRHIMPNVLGPAIVLGTTLVAQMILAESAMSFLGLGVQPPTASWGSMLRDGWEFTSQAPMLLVYPGAMIVASVFGFNLLGEGLRDALDPKE